MIAIRDYVRGHVRDPNPVAYTLMFLAAVFFPLVVQFATKLHIHPAIVAGRVRFERKNFRMLSHYVGSGEIRRHFAQ